MIKALYAEAFDIFTFNHLDVIKRTLKFCPRLIIGVNTNYSENHLFSKNERIKLINSCLDQEIDFLTNVNISVIPFTGLLVDFAKQIEASLLIKRVGSHSDFEYENNLSSINKELSPNLETVFLPGNSKFPSISYDMLMKIVSSKGDITKFVPNIVANAINKKLFPSDF